MSNQATSTTMTWPQFKQATLTKECKLLKRLDEFPNAVLVTGCQRSGTTMLSRIITQSEGMVNYYFGPDDELDAALILSGLVKHTPQGRYCFQTTYLDQCYREYYEHGDSFKIIWVLRNPYSTIYSLLYNWTPRALDNTFSHFAAPSLTGPDKLAYKLRGLKGVSRVKRAASIYNSKLSQLVELHAKLGVNRIQVVDYDDLVLNKTTLLPKLYHFIELDYHPAYAEKIHSRSLKKSSGLSEQEHNTIQHLCEASYLQAKELVDTEQKAK